MFEFVSAMCHDVLYCYIYSLCLRVTSCMTEIEIFINKANAMLLCLQFIYSCSKLTEIEVIEDKYFFYKMRIKAI